MPTDRQLTAAEAAAALGVSLPTLYAYVSRGLLSSVPAPEDPRARRYPREEVERLRSRRELRRHPETAAPRALAWGEPVLESALTLVADGRLYYRGHDAVALSRESSLEEVAALLWTGDLTAAAELFAPGAAPAWPPPPATLGPLERLQAAMPLGAAADGAAWDLRPPAVARCGARIVRLATAALAAGASATTGGTAAAGSLALAWQARGRDPERALSAALVLVADHELNVSTFAARCAASAEATPWDVVAAGLATIRGRRHGGASLRAAALLREATASSPRAALSGHLRRGEPLPGFGHPLYPDGDPRATELLRVAAVTAPRARSVAVGRDLAAAAAELLGEHPNLDLALAVVAGALRLPDGASLGLFALGRIVGWVAHATEEYARATLIRPRARYVGPLPQSPAAG